MTAVLAVLLALAAGFTIGHRTARIVHVPVGATEVDDQAALLADDVEPKTQCDCPPTQAGLTLCERCPGQKESTTS
ncbi:hypothetical protein ACQEV4_40335 [Streptomyces shenzhenensis]|uniref:hypothetical protein n=1 Tax=Streptomyces shenzhenensis TaxID=943815 RepID=UPI003D8D1D46